MNYIVKLYTCKATEKMETLAKRQCGKRNKVTGGKTYALWVVCNPGVFLHLAAIGSPPLITSGQSKPTPMALLG